MGDTRVGWPLPPLYIPLPLRPYLTPSHLPPIYLYTQIPLLPVINKWGRGEGGRVFPFLWYKHPSLSLTLSLQKGPRYPPLPNPPSISPHLHITLFSPPSLSEREGGVEKRVISKWGETDGGSVEGVAGGLGGPAFLQAAPRPSLSPISHIFYKIIHTDSTSV